MNAPIQFDRSFASHENAKYWSDKNGDVKPKDVYKGSHKKYWFDCDTCNHSFDSSLSNVTGNGRWCPYCGSSKLCDDLFCNNCFTKSFASHEKAKYWSVKNVVNPRDAFKNSDTKYWFDCVKCPHKFNTALKSISKGVWCPYCATPVKQLCDKSTCEFCFTKSFASHEKAKYWSDKNGDVKPRDISYCNGNKYWFDCNTCNHSFHATLASIVRGNWCSYCANKTLCNEDCNHCFEKSFASHEKAKYWSDKNGDVKPNDVFKGSHKKYWFDCDKCPHSFDSSLSNISGGKWCPYCGSSKLCDDSCCNNCFTRSFASHEKVKYWSDKNGDVKPRDVSLGSNTKYWFDCDKCNHSFDTSTISSINQGCWCPYCTCKQLCKAQDCKYCFTKSFASHEKAKYWSDKNGDMKPNDAFKSSNKKYWFDCNNCNHSFDSTLAHINQGNWCPYCAVPLKQLCDKLNCDFCFNNSFASHPKEKYWSDKNGDVKPRDVSKSNGNKYWFDCNTCNRRFDMTLSGVVRGNWCPYCKNKTEQKLYEALKPLYPTLITQFKQEWCKNKLCLPFDFCIPEHKIIIELDGRQHFKQVWNWTSPEKQFENDKYKEKCANENGYSVIRLLQEDALNNKHDWFDRIQTEIENIIKDDTIIHNVYMAEDGEYDAHITE